MAVRRCPNCGNEVPSELGQHAENLVSGTVDCPHCGASVELRDDAGEEPAGNGGVVERAEAAPPGQHEDEESFSGAETLGELAEDVQEKQ